MKITYTRDEVPQPLQVLRQSGYSHFIDPNTKKSSYILKPTAGFYPRFHLYLKQTETSVVFDLHLDQKKPSYGGSNMHGGEYDGPTVEKEMARIDRWVQATSGKKPSNTPNPSSSPRPVAQKTKREDTAEKSIQTSKSPPQPKQENTQFGGIFG